MTRGISRGVCAFLLSTIAAAGQSGDAAAQADLNVETRIDEARPRFTDRLPSIGEPTIQRRVERRLKPPEELDALIAELPSFRALRMPLSRLAAEQRRTLIRQLGERAYTRVVVERRKPPERKVAVNLSLTVGPTLDSNIIRSSLPNRGDGAGSLGIAGRLAVPVGGGFDQLVLSGSATATRHARSPGRDFDSVYASAAYDIVELVFDPLYNTSKTATGRMIKFAVATSASYQPGFRGQAIAFVTPSVGLHRMNVPLTSQVCRDSNGKAAYCHYADATARLGLSWSERPSARNLHASLSGSIGWRVPDTDLTLALAADVTGRTYSEFPGGREDVAWSFGPRFEHTIAPSVGWTLAVRRIEQISSIAAAGYRTIVVSAQWTIALGGRR